MMDTSTAECLIRVGNQVEKWAQGFVPASIWHRLKIGAFTTNQGLWLRQVKNSSNYSFYNLNFRIPFTGQQDFP